MNQSLALESTSIPQEFQDVFAEQKAYYMAHRNPDYKERVTDLKALQRMLVENREALIEAVNEDYGCRSRFETIISELLANQDGILDAIKHLKKWMKPQKRHLDMTQYPLAKARVIPQPLGVVGIVVPWNFPISMAFAPLTGIFAAGNTAMIKMSENSNALARLFRQLAPRYFPRGKLAFFEDGNGRGPMFTRLPFDHLFFTGSPATGKAVMANCAAHLTPVTLELGGKSPAVVAPDFPMVCTGDILYRLYRGAGRRAHRVSTQLTGYRARTTINRKLTLVCPCFTGRSQIDNLAPIAGKAVAYSRSGMNRYD
jgi:coniferyl-aldehyde dehydrogenase